MSNLKCVNFNDYQRASYDLVPKPDCLEKAGKNLNLLAYIGGKKYEVKDQTFEKHPKLSTVTKVFLTILLIVFAPITLPLACLGMLFTLCSKSHKKCVKAHEAFLKAKTNSELPPPPPRIPPIPERLIDQRKERPQFHNLPQGYENVIGQDQIQIFLNGNPNKETLTEVAQAGRWYRSGLERRSIPMIDDLVLFASKEQTSVIVQAVVDFKEHVRLILATLFYAIDGNLHNKEELLSKVKLIFNMLTEDQKMRLLSIEETSVEEIDHELKLIPMDGFYKWKKELHLSDQFLAALEQLSSYKKIIDKTPKAHVEYC